MGEFAAALARNAAVGDGGDDADGGEEEEIVVEH